MQNLKRSVIPKADFDGPDLDDPVRKGALVKVVEQRGSEVKITLLEEIGEPTVVVPADSIGEPAELLTPLGSHAEFAAICAKAAIIAGVDAHYLLVLAHQRSGIANTKAIIAGIERFGPFQIAANEWETLRRAPEFSRPFSTTDIVDPLSQALVVAEWVFASQQSLADALNGRMPSAVDLYLATLLGDRLAGAIASAALDDGGAAQSVKEVMMAALAGVADAGPRVAALLEAHAVLLTNGQQPLSLGEVGVALEALLEPHRVATVPLVMPFVAPANTPNDPVSPMRNPDTALLFRRSTVSFGAPVSGHLIVELQEALGRAGHSAGKVDGVFGSLTETALKAWQSANELPQTGAVTEAQWAILTGSSMAPDIYSRCAQLTAAFENGAKSGVERFGAVNETNFDNTVLTFGYHGYTLTGGNLQKLLSRIFSEVPADLDKALSTAQVTDIRLLLETPELQQVAVGKAIFLSDEKTKPKWITAFAKLGESRAVRDLQLKLSKEVYWTVAEEMRKRLGFTEPEGHALCFDVAIQNGKGKLALIDGVLAEFAEKKSKDELSKRNIFADHVANSSKKEFVADVRARKRTLAGGSGQVHKANYRLADWGFAPAEAIEADIGEDVPGPVAVANPNFDSFFRMSLPHVIGFQPGEFLVKGASHANNGLNTDPPRELWNNILALAEVLQKIKDSFGGPNISISSVYRSPAYNRAIGGAKDSQHKFFRAADISVAGKTPSQVARLVREMRASAVFRGGVGLYRTFVHVDTRGVNADW